MSETVITLLVTFHETRAEVNYSRLGISLWCNASIFRWYSCMAYASFSRNLCDDACLQFGGGILGARLLEGRHGDGRRRGEARHPDDGEP